MACMMSVYAAPPVVIDISRYGAVGDGKVLNTLAIQKAIDVLPINRAVVK